MSLEPEVVANYECAVGECPLWHPEEQRLYWTDQFTGRMFHYQPATGAHTEFYNGTDVTGFTFQESGSLLLFMDSGKVAAWDDGELTTVIDGVPELAASRFNDVIADPEGRVFCGTQPAKEDDAFLYRLDTTGELVTLLETVKLANGMAFSPELDQLYLSETMSGTIHRFEYEKSTGELSNQSTVIEIPESEGLPDGVTVDDDGYVWVAIYGGGCVIRFTPDGTEESRIEFPTQDITSLTFGGPSLTEMYVTSAAHRSDDEYAGALFRVSTDDISGTEEFHSTIPIA